MLSLAPDNALKEQVKKALSESQDLKAELNISQIQWKHWICVATLAFSAALSQRCGFTLLKYA